MLFASIECRYSEQTGTRWVIAQGIADPKRVAIAGGSYGGYSALMGLVLDADSFRCDVAWNAVTDLDMLHTVDWDDVSADCKRQGMPVLPAYCSADKRVPIVHGQTFRKALQPVNPALEWVEYLDEGHGWRVPANQVDFWNRTSRFLDKHLAPTQGVK